ncbi:hypothetical protein ARAM_001217 [Aspergillus rambellii]|uniref:Myb-like DNA-binding domain-containing protein n=1 Tax=Aspergillus rambellii TaxID=308745 RepID=A0A0F8X579_9EURO|nr:hypothetical protein ARAM_001217 [Aspergillus rambellii]
MSTVRRGKAMPTDGPTAKFLYTIIKQLDLKCIDWNLVASQLEISNGHAARMRYSRFRQQMEGITSTPRSSRTKKAATKSTKAGASAGKGEMQKEISPPPTQMVKQESGMGNICQPSPYIKTEPYSLPIRSMADIPHIGSLAAPNPHSQQSGSSYPQITTLHADMVPYTPIATFQEPSAGYQHASSSRMAWTPIKNEPQPDTHEHGGMGNVLLKMEISPEDEISRDA